MAEIALVALLVALTAYAVLGGADFGAGFWDLTAGGAERGARVRGMVKRSMGPVWEANHVWLILALVLMWTCFPVAFSAVMQTLYVPLFAVALGIVLRGGAFALRGEAATIAEARALGAIFALSSVLVPFFLGATVGAVAAGEVPVGEAGAVVASWTGAVSILAGAISVATGAYLAAVFLAADSARAGEPGLVEAFRARAIGAGLVAGALAIAGLPVLSEAEPALYDGLTSGAGLGFAAISGLAGAVTLALVATRRFGPARFGAAIAVGAIVAGLAAAMSPDLLPGALTFSEAAASDGTLTAMLVVVALAVAIVVPSLALLYRLTLRGKLDQELHPIGSDGKP